MTTKTEKQTMWAFMKAMSWSSMELGVGEVQEPELGSGQPQKFIPVFLLKEDVERFAGEDTHLIVELRAY